MTNITHTPGPWQQDWQYIVASDPAGVHADIYVAEIAEEDSEGRIATPEQQAANGRLIAAAPDLLAACELVIHRQEKGNLAGAVRACQAAVELATDGGPPWGISQSVAATGQPYTVLLYHFAGAWAEEPDLYYAFVEASDPTEAVAAAQARVVGLPYSLTQDPTQLYVLLVLEGHHEDKRPFTCISTSFLQKRRARG